MPGSRYCTCKGQAGCGGFGEQGHGWCNWDLFGGEKKATAGEEEEKETQFKSQNICDKLPMQVRNSPSQGSGVPSF